MKYTELPYVGKPVSRLVFGTGNDAFRSGIRQDDFLDEVFAAGITAIDTGRVYGMAEDVLGEWLSSRGMVDRVVIIGKGGHPDMVTWEKRISADAVRSDLAVSCEKLRTDHIDVYLLHRDDPEVEAGRIVELLNALHEEGKIGAFGGSNWTHRRIAEANAYARQHGLIPFTVSSPNFSLARQIADPWGGNCVSVTGPENADARGWYERTQMPLIAYSGLANGLLSGRVKSGDPGILGALPKETVKGYGCRENIERLARCEELAEKKGAPVSQIALAWMFAQRMNVLAIATSTSAERMRVNAAAADLELTEEECRYLETGR